MAYVESTVIHEGTDVTNLTISYERTVKVCTGIGTLDITLVDSGRNYDPWDRIDVYEFGNRIGKFLVISDERVTDGTRKLACQDYSKRLSDYFIDRTYLVNSVTYSVYWVDLICDLAGVNVEYGAGITDGEIVAPSTSFGFATAYDDIMRLLQMNGWFMYFDSNGTLQIEIINRPLNHVDETIDDSEVLDFESRFDDSMLRNRAVVWGNANPLTGLQVFVDVTQPSPYLYDSDDERSVAMGNSHIYDHAKAMEIAILMLTEFNKPTFVKKFTILNEDNIYVGDIVRSNCNYWRGRGRVTTIVSNLSDGGLLTTIFLDERCPRLFTYFGPPPTIADVVDVWVGTAGSGVWKCFVSSGYAFWSDDSYAIPPESLYIRDLFINNTRMATIAGDSLYQKSTESYAWSKVITPIFTDLENNTFSGMQVSGTAVSMRPLVGTTVAAYNYSPIDGMLSGYTTDGIMRSWIIETDSSNAILRAEPVSIVEDNGDVNEYITVIDIEALDDYNIVTGLKTFNREFFYWWTQNRAWGEFTNQTRNRATGIGLGTKKYGVIDSKTFNGGPQQSFSIDSGVNAIYHTSSTAAGLVVENNHMAWSLNGDSHLVGYNTLTIPPEIVYDYPVSFTGVGSRQFLLKDGNSFDIFGSSIDFDLYNDYKVHIAHWRYILGDTSATFVGNTAFELKYDADQNVDFICSGVVEDHFIVLANSRTSLGALEPLDCLEVILYNVSTAAGYKVNIFERLTGVSLDPDYLGDGYTPFFASAGNGIFVGATWAECYKEGEYHDHIQIFLEGAFVSQFGGLFTVQKYLIHEMRASEDGGDVITGIFSPGYVMRTIDGVHYCTAQGNRAFLTWEFEINVDLVNSGDFIPVVHNIVMSIGCSGGAISISGFDEIVYNDGDYYLDTSFLHWHNNESLYYGITGVGYVTPVSVRSYYSPCVVATIWRGGYVEPAVDGSVVIIRVQGLSTSVKLMQDFTEDIITYSDAMEPLEVIDDISGNLYLKLVGTGNMYAVKAYGDMQVNAEIIYAINFPPSTLMLDLIVGPKMICRPAMAFEFLEPIVMKHTSAIATSGYYATTVDSVREQTIGNFEIIHRPPVPVKVEISKGAPTVIYATENWLSYIPYMAASLTNGINSFYESALKPTAYDVRVFDFVDPQYFPSATPISGTSFERFVGVADGSGFAAQPFTLQGEWGYLTQSGNTSRIETTNYNYPYPWLFYTISGLTISGISISGISYSGGRFFARSPLYGWWNVSYGMPNAEITIIRTDDMM